MASKTASKVVKRPSMVIRDPNEIRKMGLKEIRDVTLDLNDRLDDVYEGEVLVCQGCGLPMRAEVHFYMNKHFFFNRYPVCKECVLAEVEQRPNKKSTKKPRETKESVQKMLQKMDLMYDDELYNRCYAASDLAVTNGGNWSSPFKNYMKNVNSLIQYKDTSWADSIFPSKLFEDAEDTINENSYILKKAKKRFGEEYSNPDLMFLETEYEEWCSRVEVTSKSQEYYVEQICLQKLEINKDRRLGIDVTTKLKALDILMNGANLQPKQNVGVSATDNKTLGMMIDEWEQEKPIPEVDPMFKDVDSIGHYIRVWFAGWICKILGFNNVYSQECEEEIEKYTVHKNEGLETDEQFDDYYENLFGSDGDSIG